MHILYDEDEYETVVESRPCTTCQGERRKCVGVGCNGSSGISSRRRSPEEIAKIKAQRRQEEEDDILAKADAIRLRRALSI